VSLLTRILIGLAILWGPVLLLAVVSHIAYLLKRPDLEAPEWKATREAFPLAIPWPRSDEEGPRHKGADQQGNAQQARLISGAAEAGTRGPRVWDGPRKRGIIVRMSTSPRIFAAPRVPYCRPTRTHSSGLMR
jgi:hypothetical protein